LSERPQDRSWLWRDAILHDPDGHEILLLYAGDNKLNPPWRVERLQDYGHFAIVQAYFRKITRIDS
jgi:hypothetical protein